MIRWIKDKHYRWEINAKHNRWIDDHMFWYISILMFPYLIAILGSSITKDVRWVFMMLAWIGPMFLIMSIRMNPITEEFCRCGKEDVLEFFSDRWIHRNKGEYIYIILHDNKMMADIYSYEPNPDKWRTMMFGPDYFEKNYRVHKDQKLFEWNMSGICLLSKEEIKDLELDAVEAKILLGIV